MYKSRIWIYFGTVDIVAGGLPRPDSYPQLDVIIPPQGGHGKDIYKEPESNALVYSRIENDRKS